MLNPLFPYLSVMPLVVHPQSGAIAIVKANLKFSPHNNLVKPSTTTSHPTQISLTQHPPKMPQGAFKKAATPKGPKPNVRHAAVAKKKSKTSSDRLSKKLTAGMVVKTEKLLGQRVGHLELIGTGKRDKTIVKKAGGTKKFG